MYPYMQPLRRTWTCAATSLRSSNGCRLTLRHFATPTAQALARKLERPPRKYEGLQRFWDDRETKYRNGGSEAKWNIRGIVDSIRSHELPLRTTSWYTVYVGAVTVPFHYMMHAFHLESVLAHLQVNATCLTACTGTLTTALFLMLSFRMNKASERHWEGRGMCGLMLANVRAISVSAMSYVTKKETALDLSLAAFAVARTTQLHLQRRSDECVRQELQDVLSAEQLAELLAAPHKPFFAVQQLSQKLGEAHRAKHLSTRGLVSLQERTSRMMDIITALERIEFTPEPWSYQKHMRMIITVWLAALPLTLVASIPKFAFPFCVVAGYIVLKMDSVSGELMYPIGDDHSDIPLCIAVDRLQEQLSWQLQNYVSKSSEAGVAPLAQQPGCIDFNEPWFDHHERRSSTDAFWTS
eukprot:TRINITY_DN33824_c0_g1_i1.p1 TRINITY_DN33824_c0_g1~~TRINITY_DN33824_c0_g1_i1.p1  ORF type:complete len:411 (-),score=55.76 TRINITY_DN33824_c0_g1_i1:11-1243(-)